MTERPIDIIVCGHLCIDLIPGMRGIAPQSVTRPGVLLETDPIGISTGGAVSNTGLALQRLGTRVKLMANVGDDLLASLILDFLKQRDPALVEHIKVKPGQPCSYTVVLQPGGADRTFLHCAGTNATFGADDVDDALVGQARMFHLGYPPILPRLIADDGRELEDIYRRAKDAGAVTSLDMSAPDPNGVSGRADWGAILRRTLPYVDYFLPSFEEILFMTRRADFDAWHGAILQRIDRAYVSALADELLALGAGVVGFKLGEYGLYLKSDGRRWPSLELYQPAFAVDVAGTTGAGDAAYAGFLAAVLAGLAAADCLRMAAAVAACCCEAPDATSGVRTWDATQARLDAGWPLRPERLAGF
jgi:sugar/nucleoside kinase (ribokinase family)